MNKVTQLFGYLARGNPMNFNLTDEQTLLQKTVRRFADEVIAPGAIEREDTSDLSLRGSPDVNRDDCGNPRSVVSVAKRSHLFYANQIATSPAGGSR